METDLMKRSASPHPNTVRIPGPLNSTHFSSMSFQTRTESTEDHWTTAAKNIATDTGAAIFSDHTIHVVNTGALPTSE